MAEAMRTDSRRTELEPIDTSEALLVSAFRAHPVLASFDRLARSQVLTIALQRRFVSHAFTPLYDVAIDCVSDPPTKRCLREILREEYMPYERPTHREDLVQDLMTMGATWEQIVTIGPTAQTSMMIADMFAALRKQEERALFEIKVLSFLRFAGEVLVAEEYQLMWPRFCTLGLAAPGSTVGTPSAFYHPHMQHDAVTFRFSEHNRMLSRQSHSDQLTELLRCRIENKAGIACCLESVRRAAQLKAGFYDQFVESAVAGSEAQPTRG